LTPVVLDFLQRFAAVSARSWTRESGKELESATVAGRVKSELLILVERMVLVGKGDPIVFDSFITIDNQKHLFY